MLLGAFLKFFLYNWVFAAISFLLFFTCIILILCYLNDLYLYPISPNNRHFFKCLICIRHCSTSFSPSNNHIRKVLVLTASYSWENIGLLRVYIIGPRSYSQEVEKQDWTTVFLTPNPESLITMSQKLPDKIEHFFRRETVSCSDLYISS